MLKLSTMISDELVKFVREQLTANIPKEQIAAILRPGGWTDADVAEAIQAVHLVPTPLVPTPPVFQHGQVGVNMNTVVSPTQGLAGQLGSPVVNPANPTGVQTQFQTAFRLQTMPAVSSSRKKWPIIFVLILFLLLLAGAGVWYFLYRDKSSAVEPQQEQTIVPEAEKPLLVESTPPPPFDQDLLVSWSKIPDEQNSAAAVIAAAKMLSKADTDFLSKYFSKGYDIKNLPMTSSANTVGARTVGALNAFMQSSTTPSFQCFVGVPYELCNFQSVRSMGQLLLLRSYVLERAGKVSEALSLATGLVDFGRKATAGAYELMQMLTGWTLQKDGYQRTVLLKGKLPTPFSVSPEEKTTRINALRDEHKRVLKFLYTGQTEFLEYLVDKDKVPTFPPSAEDVATADEYRKSITLGKFSLEETKKYFYDSYKTAIANVDLACGSPLAKAPYDFSAEVNNATTTSNQSSIENYVGKILYWTTYASFDTLNAKRCEVEALVNKF